jgi:cholesterol transport system auxiliary component
MNNPLGATILFLFFASLCLSACTVLPKPKAVVVDRYTLDVPPAADTQGAPAARPAEAPVLLIPRPLARADLDTPRMAYREQDYALRYFANSRWADVPPQLLLPGLIEAFEASGQYAAVIRVGSAAVPQLRMDTEVLDFSQDFREEPSMFRLRLRVQLLDLETRKVIAGRIFETRQAAPEASPAGGARAANAAWQALLPDIVAFVNARLPAVAP